MLFRSGAEHPQQEGARLRLWSSEGERWWGLPGPAPGESALSGSARWSGRRARQHWEFDPASGVPRSNTTDGISVMFR